MTPSEARKLDVDVPVHVVCTCGKANCVAPAPAGCKGTVYDPGRITGERRSVRRIHVDLLGQNHLHHHDDCGCVFEFKIEDVTLR